MTQSKRAGAVQAIVRGRLPEIRAWQADGVSGHTIAGRLGIAESSYRDALKAVAAETQEPGPSVNVDVRQPVSTHALVPLVHDGLRSPWTSGSAP